MDSMKLFIREERGQGMAEYALIISLISIALLIFLSNGSLTCAIKRTYIKIGYQLYLSKNNTIDSNQLFHQFMIEQGLDSSHYNYNNGEINCEHHPSNMTPEPDPVTIPWL